MCLYFFHMDPPRNSPPESHLIHLPANQTPSADYDFTDIIGLDIVSFGFFDVKLATAGYVSNKGFLQGRHCAIVRAAQDETKCDHVQHHCDSTALKVDPC